MKSFLLISALFCSLCMLAQQPTADEQKLYDLIMAYRKQKGLPVIPLSKSLTTVAQIHVKDLTDNRPVYGNCNLHSWSSKGKWTPCCYTRDHAQASCMWSKPRELTKYRGNGYEISFMDTGGATPIGALDSWQYSPGHNAVIINEGSWNEKWNAIGVGINGNYAVVWFGREPDVD
jgi:hypothetical protein